MKTAFVLVAHLGDRGRKDEGDVIPDLTNQRFEDLEKVGLVREATAAEIKDWTPRFEAEADKHPVRTIVMDVADLEKIRDQVKEDAETRNILLRERDDAVNDLSTVRSQLEEAGRSIERLKAEFVEAVDRYKQAEETIVKLTEERDQARTALTAATSHASGEKQATTPENKQAAAPDNKQASAPKTKA